MYLLERAAGFGQFLIEGARLVVAFNAADFISLRTENDSAGETFDSQDFDNAFFFVCVEVHWDEFVVDELGKLRMGESFTLEFLAVAAPVSAKHNEHRLVLLHGDFVGRAEVILPFDSTLLGF